MKNCPTWLLGIFATACLAVGCNDNDTTLTDPPTYFFAIEVTDITSESARINVTPFDRESPFFFGAIEETRLQNDFGGDVERYLDLVVEDHRKGTDKSVAEAIAEIAVRGTQSELLESLASDTKYIAFALLLDKEGGMIGKPAETTRFTTLKAETASAFQIEVKDVTAKSATMTVTPDDMEAPYFCNIIEKSIFEQSHSGNWQNYMNNLIAYLQGDSGKTVAQVVDEITVVGQEVYQTESLSASTEYLAFAMGIDEQGRITLETVTEAFTTPEIVSNNAFEVTFANTTYDGTDFTITPENPDERYYYTMRACSYFEGMTDQEILEVIMIEDSFMMDFMATTGVTEYENEHVDNTDTGYYVFVFGYDAGTPTTSLNKFAYHTAKGEGEPSACRFTVNITNIKSRSASVTITPSDQTQMFLWDILPESEYEIQKNKLAEFAAEYAKMNFSSFGFSYERGETGNMFSRNLEPGTKYYIWAACMDEFGQAAAEVLIPDTFTTLPRSEGASEVVVTCDKYYDGDALYALDPVAYATSKGYALMPVTFAPNEATTLWYANVYETDLSDPTDPTDDEVAETLLSNGLWCPVGKPFLCKWDEPSTILVLGIDAQDNYTVTRIVKTFTKAGASPAEEYVPAEKAVKPLRLSVEQAPALLRYRPVAER